MRCFVLLCFGAACAISAFALPANCVSGTYATYVALSSGCQIGDATFSNFSGLGFTNSGGVPDVPEADIMVIPTGTTLDPSLTFEYVNSSGTPTPQTVDVMGQILSMQLNYQITLTASTMSSIQMDETFSNASPGSVSATKNAQIGTSTVFTSTVSDGGHTNPANTTSIGNVDPTSGTGIWTITDTVSLQAQNAGGSATQNSFENLYVLAPTTSTVPEPPLLFATGVIMLLMGIALKRVRQSKES